MRRIKKILLLTFTLIMMLACLGFAACKNSCSGEVGRDEVGTLPTDDLTELTLSATEMNMVVGDIERLSAWATLEEGLELQYSTSNDSIISVDNDGYVEAKLAGEATVTVKYGEQTKSCLVKVSFGGMSPLLEWVQISDTTEETPVLLMLGESLNLEARILFNQKYYSDFSVSYTTSGDVGEVQNGAFVSDTIGSGAVTAVATWRGLSGETVVTLQKTVYVEVTHSVAIIPNAKDYTVYTVGNYAGETYPTEIEFTVKVKDDNTVTSADEISVIEGSDIIEYDSTENVVRGLQYGVGKIRIEYTDFRGETHVKTVEVEVKRPVKVYSKRIEFSSMDGTLPLNELFGQSVTLIDAYQDGEEITVSQNVLSGLKMNNDSVTKSTLTVYTNMVGVEVNIDGYGKVIRTERDLKVFDLTDDDGDYKTAVNKQITGYFILANDIENDPGFDSSNLHTGLIYNKAIGQSGRDPNWLSYTETGFAGTFDGQGYTMGFDVYQGGLFGMFLNGAVVKNVGLEVNMTNTTNTMSTVLAVQAPNTKVADDVVIENVYVKVDDFRGSLNSSSTAGLIYYRTFGVCVRDTVIELGNVVCDENTYASGALFAQDERKEQQSNYISNVLVISNVPMFMGMDENTTAYNRNHKTVACTDVVKTNAETDNTTTILDERYVLGVSLGKCSTGQAIMASGKSVATDGDNQGNLYQVLGASRYNDIETAVNANKTQIGKWTISSDGIVWSEQKTEAEEENNSSLEYEGSSNLKDWFENYFNN